MELLMERSARFCVLSTLSSLLFFRVGFSLGQDVGALASSALPFIVLHGIGDACKNEGLSMFTQLLMDMTGSPGYCIEIGNGVSDSFFMRLDKQADIVCEQVKSIKSLQNGYNMVGLSQGNVIGRAVIEFCDDAPPLKTSRSFAIHFNKSMAEIVDENMLYTGVNNFVSLGGPHAGIAAVPLCKILVLCKLVDAVIRIGVYSPYVQNNFAPTGYVKIPTDMEGYYEGCLFLPRLNNELPESRNETYKERFTSINYLALIKFEQDAVLYPADTAWFGFYGPNDFRKVLPAEETDLYKEDWIGLKTLNEAGKVAFLSLPGGHLSITEAEMLEMVVPYLLPTFKPLQNFATLR